MRFGFILTRHVNSHLTNRYWIRSVSLINKLYPTTEIIIIDDNSNRDYLTADVESKLNNLTVIDSVYPGRGELLPFIYLLKHKWFDSAVIMHDGVFVHKKIDFEHGPTPNVLPLWHYPYNNEAGQDDYNHIMYLAGFLSSQTIQQKLHVSADTLAISMSVLKKDGNDFNLCFGSQTYIKLPFLEKIEQKYKITNLINQVKSRRDRCALERIMGCIFHAENPMELNKIPSLFGDIKKHKKAYSYTYAEYMQDVAQKRIPTYFVKVWSGR